MMENIWEDVHRLQGKLHHFMSGTWILISAGCPGANFSKIVRDDTESVASTLLSLFQTF